MNAIIVGYVVRPEFVDQNKANIRRTMDKKYVAFTQEDNQTFVHINISKDESTFAQFISLEELQAFQKALCESEPL